MTTLRQSGYKALRLGRVSLPGHVYLVTFATSDRRRIFESVDTARIAASCISDPRLWRDASLLAWVLMPDHWHGLIQLGQEANLSATVQKLKANTARCVRLAYPSILQVWEKGFHDRALRSEENVEHAARYLVYNPVRAGLVARVGDYPYWDAAWL